jgi:hypothetical protein
MIAYAFLQHQRLKQARRKKESIPGYRNQLCRPSDAPSSRRYRENKSANDLPTTECASERMRNHFSSRERPQNRF